MEPLNMMVTKMKNSFPGVDYVHIVRFHPSFICQGFIVRFHPRFLGVYPNSWRVAP